MTPKRTSNHYQMTDETKGQLNGLTRFLAESGESLLTWDEWCRYRQMLFERCGLDHDGKSRIHFLEIVMGERKTR